MVGAGSPPVSSRWAMRSRISAMSQDVQHKISGLVYRSDEAGEGASAPGSWDQELAAAAQAPEVQDSARAG